MIVLFKKVLKKVVPRSVIRIFKKKPVLISGEDVDHVLKIIEDVNYRKLLQRVSLSRSVYDEMYTNGVHYLQVGLSAIKCIKTAISNSKVNEVREILDMACGHGRVLRFFAESFPGSDVTACDTNLDGVDFCKKELGAHPVYSKHSIKNFKIDKKFDLIWCGSLATHFNSEGTTELLSFFHQHLKTGGLLVFSMHGTIAVEFLTTRKYNYGLLDESIEKVLSETAKNGYGYADYPRLKGYGISVVTPVWMQKRLNEVGKWRDYQFYEGGWSYHHDVYSVVKE